MSELERIANQINEYKENQQSTEESSKLVEQELAKNNMYLGKTDVQGPGIEIKIKDVNKSLTSYKAIKNLELKHDEFAKTTTMKIKRYVELQKDKEKNETKE